MIIRQQFVHILARDGPDRSGFGGGDQGQRYVETALYGRLAACHMILDNPPNQIAWRGSLSLGKHLELLEDLLRKFHCSLHSNHCPMSGSLGELLTIDRAFAQMK
jgi:hypothetical protein